MTPPICLISSEILAQNRHLGARTSASDPAHAELAYVLTIRTLGPVAEHRSKHRDAEWLLDLRNHAKKVGEGWTLPMGHEDAGGFLRPFAAGGETGHAPGRGGGERDDRRRRPPLLALVPRDDRQDHGRRAADPRTPGACAAARPARTAIPSTVANPEISISEYTRSARAVLAAFQIPNRFDILKDPARILNGQASPTATIWVTVPRRCPGCDWPQQATRHHGGTTWSPSSRVPLQSRPPS